MKIYLISKVTSWSKTFIESANSAQSAPRKVSKVKVFDILFPVKVRAGHVSDAPGPLEHVDDEADATSGQREGALPVGAACEETRGGHGELELRAGAHQHRPVLLLLPAPGEGDGDARGAVPRPQLVHLPVAEIVYL